MTLDVTFSGTRVVVDRDPHGPFVCTTLHDGTQVMARPLHEPWEHTRLHDLLHVILADGVSASLWAAAHPRFAGSPVTIAREESRVLAAQTAILAALEVGD